MVHAVLLIGSNLGDRRGNLDSGSRMVHRLAGPVVRKSAVYACSPWGFVHQPDFLNQVLVVETSMSPLQLLDCLQGIERQVGRTPAGRWMARTLDIDILFFGSEILATDRLTVPHPLLPSRRFALVPAVEVLPDFIHPQLNTSLSALLARCPDDGIVLPESQTDTALA